MSACRLCIAAPRELALTDAADLSGLRVATSYPETLKAWRVAFDRAAAAEALPAGFDQRFRNLWRFYLMYCEGGFRGGGITVSQATLVKR